MEKGQPIEANDHLIKLMIADVTDVTNVLPMQADVNPMVAKEFSVAHPRLATRCHRYHSQFSNQVVSSLAAIGHRVSQA